MVACTQFQAKLRPKFREIIALLLPDLPESFEEISYYHSEECAETAMKDEMRNAEKERAAVLGLEIKSNTNSMNSIGGKEKSNSLSNSSQSGSSIRMSRTSTTESDNQISNDDLIFNKKILNSHHGSASQIQTIVSSQVGSMQGNDYSGNHSVISKSTPCVVITDNALTDRGKPHLSGSTRNVRVSKL